MKKYKIYLLVSKKYPYRAYGVGTKERCEEILSKPKYQKGYYIREELDEEDGQYTIIYSNGGLCHCIRYDTLTRILREHKPYSWVGTKRDWLKMEGKDISVHQKIMGFGQTRSMKESQELNRTTL